MEKIPTTATGYVRMEAELKNLKSVERPNVIKAIAEARAHGDLSENAEYAAAKEKQSFIEGRIKELEDKISRADVIDIASLKSDTVKFGATVKLADEDSGNEASYQIVGEYEADLKSGQISITSPMARALIGKKKGDSVEVKTPKGAKSYEVLAIQYK
ncbi:MAG: transcription elongation factor GreA [Pseudomonadota bacterium]|nr:transcription elongation factor GreA [Pseudomonadota bacterium]